jgi:D-alanyl-D-alanine carboxypeptidase
VKGWKVLKRFFSFIIGCLAVVAFAEPVAAAGLVPDLTAKSAIVMEASTGKILYQKDADSLRYPASTTKIMTLLVALENGNLDDMVTVSTNAAQTEGSSLWLESGERMKLSDLLYGMMLVSGNDATVAVAEHIAGSVDAFAKLMTAKAHEIGAVNTSFVNSSGLPDPNHYTTARDLALIAAYGYKNPMFRQIVSTKEKQVPWAAKNYNRELFNENRMLWLYDGGNGVKTGYTDAAGRCLVSAANRNGVQLVSVVLDSEFMWNDSIALLDYGFPRVQPVDVLHKGDIVKTVDVISGKKSSLELKADALIRIPVVEGEHSKFKTVVEAPNQVSASIHQGDPVGRVKVMYEDREVAAANLVAAESIEKKSFFSLLRQKLFFTMNYLKSTLA